MKILNSNQLSVLETGKSAYETMFWNWWRQVMNVPPISTSFRIESRRIRNVNFSISATLCVKDMIFIQKAQCVRVDHHLPAS